MKKETWLRMIEITDTVADQKKATRKEILQVAKMKSELLENNQQVRILPKRSYTLFKIDNRFYIGCYDNEKERLLLNRGTYNLWFSKSNATATLQSYFPNEDH